MLRKHAVRALALCLALAATAAIAQPVLVAGAATPFKLARTPGGNFLLTESGTGAHDGAVHVVSVWGDRFRLLSGLPSAVTSEGGAIGPTGVADAHRTVYIVLGEGDSLGESVPPTQVPNPEGISSAIFSSLLRARFEPVPDGIREGFALTAADHQALADGHTVVKTNDSGERVEIDLLADFRDLAPDPVLSVRQSNPFAATVAGGLTADDLDELGFAGDVAAADFFARLFPDTALGRRFEERRRVYVVDAGMNTVVEVDAVTGRWRVLARVPPQPNPLFPGFGGPVMDPVPTGIHLAASGELLVTILPGFPFPPGAAKVLSVDRASGALTTRFDGLSSATDVLEVGGATYVVELSTDFLAGAPGRVVRFAAPGAAPEVVAGGLIGPTGLAHDPSRDELLVAESFTGRVRRIPLTP
jgi:hypothetical protein